MGNQQAGDAKSAQADEQSSSVYAGCIVGGDTLCSLTLMVKYADDSIVMVPVEVYPWETLAPSLERVGVSRSGECVHCIQFQGRDLDMYGTWEQVFLHCFCRDKSVLRSYDMSTIARHVSLHTGESGSGS